MQMLKDKIVFITGASSGIGKACAELFAKEGAKLILGARREHLLYELSNELKNKYDTKSLCLKIDVKNKELLESEINNLNNEWNNIDILINNAGLALGLDKFYEVSINDLDEMIETNIKGAFYCARLVLNNMIKRNEGHIINVGSIAGHEVYPGGSVYCATKHAIYAFTKALKMDLCGTNIRVSTVDPGMVETNFSIVRFKGDSERAKKVYENMTPLTAYDVADAILYCATRPKHVNINEIILMPTDQASATLVHRHK